VASGEPRPRTTRREPTDPARRARCGHCIRFAPEFERAAQSAASNRDLRFFAVDATKQVALSLQFSVDSYPKLVVVDNTVRAAYVFGGQRSPEALLSYVRKPTLPAEDAVSWLGPLSAWGHVKLLTGRLAQRGLGAYLQATEGAGVAKAAAITGLGFVALTVLMMPLTVFLAWLFTPVVRVAREGGEPVAEVAAGAGAGAGARAAGREDADTGDEGSE